MRNPIGNKNWSEIKNKYSFEKSKTSPKVLNQGINCYRGTRLFSKSFIDLLQGLFNTVCI